MDKMYSCPAKVIKEILDASEILICHSTVQIQLGRNDVVKDQGIFKKTEKTVPRQNFQTQLKRLFQLFISWTT
jgi:hypothetical protein